MSSPSRMRGIPQRVAANSVPFLCATYHGGWTAPLEDRRCHSGAAKRAKLADLAVSEQTLRARDASGG